MRGLFVLFSLLFLSLGLGGYLAFDYHVVNKTASMRGEEPIPFGTYLSGVMEMIGAATSSETRDDPKAEATPEALAAMLPRVPEGWTMRPTVESDAEPFLPPGARGDTVDRLRGVVRPRAGKGVKWAKFTYEKGARKVIVELIRYPDFIFTSYMALGEKMRLKGLSQGRDGTDFAIVRGMELREANLPDDYGARYFIGQVGDQIHLRMLASKAMTDQDLLPFVATLNVPAMNADVVEKTAGLGEVPLIVLTSVLDAETRKAVAAEREAEAQRRAEEQAARDAKREAQRQAEKEAAAQAAKGVTTDEETGIKVRKGTGEGTGSTFQSEGSGLDDSACRKEGGRKICGVLEDPAADEAAQD